MLTSNPSQNFASSETPQGNPSVSERKAAAKRANAQRSTGPRTPQGKARSSLNALLPGIGDDTDRPVGGHHPAVSTRHQLDAVSMPQFLERRRQGAGGVRTIAKVPAEMVLQANLQGGTEMVRSSFRAYQDAGVTKLGVAPAARDLAEKLTTLGRVMDLVRAVNNGA